MLVKVIQWQCKPRVSYSILHGTFCVSLSCCCHLLMLLRDHLVIAQQPRAVCSHCALVCSVQWSLCTINQEEDLYLYIFQVETHTSSSHHSYSFDPLSSVVLCVVSSPNPVLASQPSVSVVSRSMDSDSVPLSHKCYSSMSSVNTICVSGTVQSCGSLSDV